jgi:hypothetical protein
LSRTGEIWILRSGEHVVQLAPSRGVEILARLLARPNEEIHALTLSSDDDRELTESDAGEVLDVEALRAYRRRLGELREALDQKPTRKLRVKLEQEQTWLRRELARADRPRAGPRRAGSIAERARINVQRRLKEVLGRVEAADLPLGRYLRQAVRTGTYCTFRP